MKSGYWQLEVDRESRHRTAFALPNGGLYEWRMMPFGLKNAMATFQRAINMVLEGCDDICLSYVDDIIVFGDNFDVVINNLRIIFEKFTGSRVFPQHEKM